MPLQILFDNLNCQRFPKIPPGMVNPGVPPSRISKLLDIAGQKWHCSGMGSTQKWTLDTLYCVCLEWYYLNQVVSFSDWDGLTFQADNYRYQDKKGGMFTIGRDCFVFSGVGAMLYKCDPLKGSSPISPDFSWLYGVPAEAKIWCPSCGSLPPLTGKCKHSWERGILMGNIPGHQDGSHYPFERQNDGYTWVLPGEPPYPDLPGLKPMADPRERPAEVDKAQSAQLSLF